MFSLIWIATAQAQTVLGGHMEQGGLVVGRTEPGAKVSLDDRPVPVDELGRFLLGFGRDAPPTAALRIIRANGTEENRALAISRRDWPIQRIEGLPREKTEPDAASLARLKAETAMIRAIRDRVSLEPHFLDGLQRPAEGPVSGVFGSQRVYNGNGGAPHSGLDIAAPAGAPVRACADGIVVLAAPDLFLTGRTVMIDHGLGLISSYAHLSRQDVTAGSKIRKGDLIGAIGATGLATGPHLHWGLSWLDVRLDPERAEISLRDLYLGIELENQK
ncbi:peptidase M23/M37 family [Paramagnetospirillum magnetotacticum MS-1]|uniref:Peptidase M23/M37 family n=1 Tax=Paramagnetospirillum magnetotacticum MS-1 TaxID=272627 RepID=A0A0C2U9K6_PARME|nr:M23 family metallopeptidase [Paramagnetospirillum magnetotacticum]KIL98177.1 peptidase M23/M37 family [Paramagnetospirillum magnetotacticum MS-1]